MIGLDVDHVHPNVPRSDGTFVEACIGGVINLEHKVWDQLCKQLARGLCQLCATPGQPKLIFVVTCQAQRSQQEMKNLDRGKFVFIDHLAIAEHLFCAFPRPVEMFDGPVNEDTFEGLGFGQTD